MRTTILLPLLLPIAVQAAQQAVLTMTERPVRLIRGTVLYKAVNGTAMQRDDIIETDGSGAQVDTGAGIVALGPRTRVLLAGLPDEDKPGIDVALLQGWIKLAAHDRARVAAPTLQAIVPAGVTVVRSEGGKAAVFAEAGAHQVAPQDGASKPGQVLKLGAEQYAAFETDKPHPVIGRPPRDFLAALPPAFRDALQAAPKLSNAGKVQPVKERDVSYEDVADWLRAPPSLRRGFVVRFRPRLADPAFRKELDAQLGGSAEWRPVLHPVAAVPRPGRF